LLNEDQSLAISMASRGHSFFMTGKKGSVVSVVLALNVIKYQSHIISSLLYRQCWHWENLDPTSDPGRLQDKEQEGPCVLFNRHHNTAISKGMFFSQLKLKMFIC